MNKIALIIPYFGKFPDWMDLYLFSCSQNEFIDFHYFTDCPIPDKIYKNTIFHQISFDEYINKIKHNLHINLGGHNKCEPYKLCDVKPFLGVIHHEFISKYDWWGWGDIDVIYGDLSLLLTPKRLNKYDLITTHIKCISGHFTIVRSRSDFCNIATKIPQWKTLLEDSDSKWFDEVTFSNYIRSNRTKFIDSLWYRVYKKIKINRNSFYSFFEKIIPGHNRIFMTESYTTFKPIPKRKYLYNPTKNIFYIPGTLDMPEVKPGWYRLPYLHLLYFKKVFYYDTQYFWHEGFYKIQQHINWNELTEVEITTEHIQSK